MKNADLLDSLIPPAWSGIEPIPFRQGHISGQCLPALSDIPLDALPWNERRPKADPRFPDIQLIKKSNTRSVLRFTIRDASGSAAAVFAKRCRARNTTKRLLSIGHAGKARREWDIGREMLRLGLPTALPLLWAEKRIHGMMTENYLITLGVERAVSFAEIWRGLADAESRRTWMQSLGEQVRRGHEKGFAHDDLSSEHILVIARPDAPTYCYIDLDRARIGASVSAYRRAHNFFQIFRSLPAETLGPAERRAFFEGYSGRQWDEAAIARVENAIARIARLKAIGKSLKPKQWFKGR